MVSFTPVSPPRPYTPTSPHPYAPHAHPIFLHFITRTILGEEYKSFSSSLCSLLHSPVTSSLLGPNILLNTMFSNTLSFLSSRNVSDQVSHPYLLLMLNTIRINTRRLVGASRPCGLLFNYKKLFQVLYGIRNGKAVYTMRLFYIFMCIYQCTTMDYLKLLIQIKEILVRWPDSGSVPSIAAEVGFKATGLNGHPDLRSDIST